MQEKRRLKRWHLIYHLRIYDQQTDSLVGHVVDITTEGLRVVSEWPIPTGRDFQLWMDLPDNDSAGTTRIWFRARSLWCSGRP